MKGERVLKAQTTLVILTAKDIREIYNLTQSDTYEILRSRGCPLIKGGNGRKYLVEKSALEKFIVERTERMRRR